MDEKTEPKSTEDALKEMGEQISKGALNHLAATIRIVDDDGNARCMTDDESIPFLVALSRRSLATAIVAKGLQGSGDEEGPMLDFIKEFGKGLAAEVSQLRLARARMETEQFIAAARASGAIRGPLKH